MPYCFMKESDFPEDVGFCLLAELSGADWGLYEYQAPLDDGAWVSPTPVGDKLARLIESGKRYPPALALAGEEVVQVFGEHAPSQSEFSTAYASAISAHLSRQPEAPYILARAIGGDGIDLCRGEWYWVLRIKGSPQLASWVSDDFFVCDNPVDDFDLTGQQLKQLG